MDTNIRISQNFEDSQNTYGPDRGDPGRHQGKVLLTTQEDREGSSRNTRCS